MANAKEISLGGEFGAVALKVNGICVEVNADGSGVRVTADKPVKVSYYPANENKTSTAIGAVLKELEVGDQLKDGTICIAVDLKNNEALVVSGGIFSGESDFCSQDDVVRNANKFSLHGHKDWRRITDDDGKKLADN